MVARIALDDVRREMRYCAQYYRDCARLGLVRCDGSFGHARGLLHLCKARSI